MTRIHDSNGGNGSGKHRNDSRRTKRQEVDKALDIANGGKFAVHDAQNQNKRLATKSR